MSTDSIKFTSEYIPEDISINKQVLLPIKKSENMVPFWSDNPNVLFQNQFITEFFPVKGMSFTQSLNAITRSIIILSVIGFALTRNLGFFGALIITMVAIYFYYQTQRPKNCKEGFDNAGLAVIADPSINKYDPVTNKKRLETGFDGPNTVFDENTPVNPFSNVLLTDYDMNPNKKPAPPAANSEINDRILAQAKKTVIDLNHEQSDIADKLFKDLGENLEFEQSMRNFYSNPSTTIPNDQAAFAEFCYGGMISCKEGNAFACARNLERYTN
jgi:hypothetical protein